MASRAVYQAQAAGDEERYDSEMVIYNAHVPLSPSVHAFDGEIDSLAEVADYRDGDRFLLGEDRRNENTRRLLKQLRSRYRRDHHKVYVDTSKLVRA